MLLLLMRMMMKSFITGSGDILKITLMSFYVAYELLINYTVSSPPAHTADGWMPKAIDSNATVHSTVTECGVKDIHFHLLSPLGPPKG